jgi:parallel beta-helix repeat protein
MPTLSRQPAARRARPARTRLSLIALEERTVPSTLTVDPAFANSAALRQYSTIGAAVAAAAPGDTIKVDPGLYTEVVTVSKPLTLVGSGPAATARTGDPAQEAVVQGTSADPLGVVNLRANHIVFEGFTVQGNTQGPGVFTDPAFSGYDVEGNLVWKNNPLPDAGGNYPNTPSGGLHLNSSGAYQTVVRGNAFEDHYAESFGDGVYTELTVSNAVIDHNYFAGNVHYSVDFAGAASDPGFPGFKRFYPRSASVQVTGNTVEQSGGFLVQYADSIQVTGNTITQATRTGVYVGGNVRGVTVSGNVLDGAADVANAYYIGRHTGIFVGTLDIPGSIQGVVISGNTITGYRNGVWLAGSAATGAVSRVTVANNTIQSSADPNGRANPDPYGYGILLGDASNNTVQNNTATGNAANGIYVDAASAGNTLTGNTATGNDLGGSDGGYDLYDASAGKRTGGTADTWSGNTFGTAYPPGLD